MRSRSDTNQNEIVAGLRKIGAAVLVVSTKAIGFDLLVGWGRYNYLVEVKRPGERKRLTVNERKVQAQFKRYLVIESVEDFIIQS